jgi:hypothetical protein
LGKSVVDYGKSLNVRSMRDVVCAGSRARCMKVQVSRGICREAAWA